MKKIITAISLLLVLLTSCNDAIQSTKTGYTHRGRVIREFEYNGHTYISLGNHGITHAGHCKCNNQ